VTAEPFSTGVSGQEGTEAKRAIQKLLGLDAVHADIAALIAAMHAEIGSLNDALGLFSNALRIAEGLDRQASVELKKTGGTISPVVKVFDLDGRAALHEAQALYDEAMWRYEPLVAAAPALLVIAKRHLDLLDRAPVPTDPEVAAEIERFRVETALTIEIAEGRSKP